MSLAKILHPQLIDNLAMGLHSRFNIKGDVKEIISFIKKFGSSDDDAGEFISSGFPIGKVQSQDHFKEVKEKGLSTDTFYNVTTGKYIKKGNPSMVYFDGYAVKRNTPEHFAILKIIEEDNSENDSESVEIDEKDGWEVVKDTNYIWSSEKSKIVGRLKNGEPIPLSQKVINMIKQSSKIPWERVDEDDLKKCRLTYSKSPS